MDDMLFEAVSWINKILQHCQCTPPSLTVSGGDEEVEEEEEEEEEEEGMKGSQERARG